VPTVDDKQAKVLTDRKSTIGERRYPLGDRVMILLCVPAGCGPRNLLLATWNMVTDLEVNIGDALKLPNTRSLRAVPTEIVIRAIS
jgi:hypothetical protein